MSFRAERGISFAVNEIEIPLRLRRIGMTDLWFAGEASRRRVRRSFALVREALLPSISHWLNKAASFHYRVARFETADKLSSLSRDVPG